MKLIEFLRLPLEDKIKGVWLSGIEGEGEYIECYESGQIWEHSHYKDGERNGEYKRWYGDGELKRHSLYENGTLIKDYLK